MKARVADPKKLVAGGCVIGAALATALVGLSRGSDGAIAGGLLFAVAGWSIVREAKEKKNEAPDLPWVRWYHLAGVVFAVGVIVYWLWRSTLR